MLIHVCFYESISIHLFTCLSKAKVYRFKDEGRKEKRLTLRGIDDAHTIEAIFFGNGPSIQIGNFHTKQTLSS